MKQIRIKAGLWVLDLLWFSLGKDHRFGGCFMRVAMDSTCLLMVLMTIEEPPRRTLIPGSSEAWGVYQKACPRRVRMEGAEPITLLPRLITDLRVFPKVRTHGKDMSPFLFLHCAVSGEFFREKYLKKSPGCRPQQQENQQQHILHAQRWKSKWNNAYSR